MIAETEFAVEMKIDGNWEGWAKVLYLPMARDIAKRLILEGWETRIADKFGYEHAAL